MIGIRGAIRVDRNERETIYRATQRLLREMLGRNSLNEDEIVSAFFTMTPDLNSDFPAYAARQMGWDAVPMLGAQETAVPGALDRMIRVLLHADIEADPEHVYLGEAAAMRPDLAREGDAAPDLESVSADVPEFGGLLVVGLGLIGGSVAMAARRSGLFSEVLGHDLREESLEKGRRAGAISDSDTDAGRLLERADAVLLSIPVARIPNWIEEWGERLVRGTVVIDVGSTKRRVVDAMEELPEGVQAVGAHPMAGSEESGIEAARPDLFHGAPWALVETSRTGSKARRLARALVGAVDGVPVWMEPAAHDRAAAATSHVPYALSAALARHVAARRRELTGPEVGALVGPGLKDMTRLASSDPRLMAEILATNWPEVREELQRFREKLDEFVAGLDAAVEAGSDEEREPADDGPVAALARELERAKSDRKTIVHAAPRGGDE